MKKLLVLAFLITLLTSLALPVFAEDASPAAMPTTVDYTLPYPGTLPGSPLYFLKTLRDKIVSFLITDPKRQAEFDLLQADKRLVAGQYLLGQKPPKTQLAIDTMSKGENYFFFAVENAAIAKKEHEDVNGLLDTMLTASHKHKEILLQLQQSAPASITGEIRDLIHRTDDIAKQVTSVKQKN